MRFDYISLFILLSVPALGPANYAEQLQAEMKDLKSELKNMEVNFHKVTKKEEEKTEIKKDKKIENLDLFFKEEQKYLEAKKAEPVKTNSNYKIKKRTR